MGTRLAIAFISLTIEWPPSTGTKPPDLSLAEKSWKGFTGLQREKMPKTKGGHISL